MNKRKFKKLIESIRCDKEKLEKFYKKYYSRLVFLLDIKYKNHMLAQDSVQEFFLKLIDKNFVIKDDIEYPIIWMYTCVENILKNFLKKENKYVPITNDSVDINTIEENDKVEYKFYEMIVDLNEIEKQILEKIYVYELSSTEIAKILNLKPANVRKIHSRAIKKLKNSQKFEK